MSDRRESLHWFFRGVAVFGLLLIVLALVSFGVWVAKAAAESGYEWFGDIPIAEAHMPLLLYFGGGALAAGAVCNLVGNFFAGFYGASRTAAVDTAESGGAAPSTEQSAQPREPAPERYRRSLSRLYAFMSGLILVLVGVGLIGGALVGPSPSSIVDFVLTVASLSVRLLFGSILGALLTAALFAGLSYGVRERSTEALLVGLVVGLLFLPVAAAMRSIGFAIFAVIVVYYSIRARGATEFKVLARADVPDGVRRFFE